MRRFWSVVTVGTDGAIVLDGRPVRTPGRAPLVPPAALLAEAIASEWRAVGETVDPRAMPLTGLANAAIDRIAPTHATFADGVARYGESDLLCYRADGPPPLVGRQESAWDPILAWARGRYDVALTTVQGVMHVAQPPATVARLRDAVAALDPWTLAPLSVIVTVTGSLLIGLAIVEEAIDAEAGWTAANVDEDWQAEQWGEDTLAADAKAARRREYDAAVQFLGALR